MGFVHCCLCGNRIKKESSTRSSRNMANNLVFLCSMKMYTTFDENSLKTCYAEYVKTRKATCTTHFIDAAKHLLADITKYGGFLSRNFDGVFFLKEGEIPVYISKKLNSARTSFADDVVITSTDIKDYVNYYLARYFGSELWEILQQDSDKENCEVEDEMRPNLEVAMEIMPPTPEKSINEDAFLTPSKQSRAESRSTNKTMGSLYSPEKQASGSTVDSEYLPELSGTDPSLLNKFFLVPGKKLLELFHLSRCGCDDNEEDVRLLEYGSAPVIEYLTTKKEKRRWEGQDKVTPSPRDKIFNGNAQACAAAVTTGLRMTNLLHWATEADVALPSRTAFYNMFAQLRPHINSVYAKHQQRALQQIKAAYEVNGKPTAWNIAVDGAFDSRGFSAEFCKVLAVDLKTKLCIHTEIVHRSETGASVTMEKEGFRRLLRWMESKNIPIRSISTDRSSTYGKEIGLYNKECGKKVAWLLDPWHLARYLDKHLRTVAKKKDCGDIKKWVGHIKTHLYHAIQKGAEAHSGSLIRDYFNSCLYHVTGVHEWIQDGTTGAVTRCTHVASERGERPVIAAGSVAHNALREVLLQRDFQKHLTMASPFGGTSRCETKNALDRLYCPKEVYLPRVTYPFYAKMATLHLNALRNAEISGERTVIRRVAIRRKYRERPSILLRKTPIEHLWRNEIYASWVSERLDNLMDEDDQPMDLT